MILLSLLCLVTALVLWIVGAVSASVLTLGFALGFSVAGMLFLGVGYAAARRSVPATAPELGAAVAPVAHRNGTSGAPAVADAPPVHGYDEMSATQVVQLVGSGALSRGQLAAVLGYEASHLARKTVLDKVEAAVIALAKQEA